MSTATILEWSLAAHDFQNRHERVLGTNLQEEFAQSAYYSLRRLSCEVGDGRVKLRGRIPAYLVKHVVQTVCDVVDRLRTLQ
jgi:hypothetical protein